MFPSSQVIAAFLVDRETLNAGIAAFYGLLDCGKADFSVMVDSRRDGPEGQGLRDPKGTGGQGATEEKRPLGSSR